MSDFFLELSACLEAAAGDDGCSAVCGCSCFVDVSCNEDVRHFFDDKGVRPWVGDVECGCMLGCKVSFLQKVFHDECGAVGNVCAAVFDAGNAFAVVVEAKAVVH